MQAVLPNRTSNIFGDDCPSTPENVDVRPISRWLCSAFNRLSALRSRRIFSEVVFSIRRKQRSRYSSTKSSSPSDAMHIVCSACNSIKDETAIDKSSSRSKKLKSHWSKGSVKKSQQWLLF